MIKITPDEIIGLCGIVPTPAVADASHWACVNSVNIPETEKMTRLVVEAGTDIVMTTGTFGECATLTPAELRDFVACVVETVAGRRPVFAGIGTLNTRETISRGRELMDIGADGLFVGRPMWLALDEAGIVQFYRDIAEALPGVPLVVYDNPSAFKGKISEAAYVALAAIPEVVAAKHVGGPQLEKDAQAVGNRCRILPLVSDWFRTAKVNPDLMQAAWSGHVACAPAPLNALAAAIRARDWDRAEKISDRCRWAEEAMFAGGDLSKFMDYSIQIGHLRFAAAGLIDPGPPRPPYHLDPPESYKNGGIETGRRWKQLQDEFGFAVTA
jgi:4-(2-carboxyphenyl)-2-oxobut-3-enoate aldolase